MVYSVERILITDASENIVNKVKSMKEELGDLKHVSIFLEGRNFVVKKYLLLSSDVHMILEFEKLNLQMNLFF